MPVDVTATATIDRPREEVAAYLRDPANDTTWIGGLRSARLLTPGQVTVGSQVERVASFLGRRVQYVNEITELTDLPTPLIGFEASGTLHAEDYRDVLLPAVEKAASAMRDIVNFFMIISFESNFMISPHLLIRP